jgi:hypothetical protein
MTLLVRQRPEGCLSDLLLDRWLAGELAGHPEGEPVRSHLGQCPACSDRLRGLQQEPALLPPPVAPRPARRASAAWFPYAAVTGLGALAVSVVMFLHARPAVQPGLRAKGDLQLEVVVRRRDGHSEAVMPGDALAAGDLVRFLVSADGGFPFVIGLDAAGAVSPYFPTAGVPLPLPAGRSQVLPGSVVLDETLGAERFLLLNCNEATNVDLVVQAGRRALRAAGGDPRRALRLDLPCRQAGVTVEKVRRP